MLKCYKTKKIIILKYDNKEILIFEYSYIKSEGDKIISITTKNGMSNCEKVYIINSNKYDIYVHPNVSIYKLKDLIDLNIVEDNSFLLKPRYYKIKKNLSYYLIKNDIIEINGIISQKITKQITNGIECDVDIPIHENYCSSYMCDITKEYSRIIKLEKFEL